MNSWLRTKLTNDPNGGGFEFGQYLAQRQRYSQILTPGPPDVFVFIDEHEQSICDGEFHVRQANPSDELMKDGSYDAGGESDWDKLPADRHNQGANLSFADGHAQPRRWQEPKKFHGYDWAAAPGADLRDLRYVQSVIPRLR